ncbi:hypothetical protein [Motiliproteus sp. SC1-56]|uniref:hypothetical protein n=1 Tax=Motiliproteus sp. SC1-56 TaxID=2799565 RepID=UPI001A8E1DD1|nr:hypothetical protein [Motiliproteus sp. SC1-56]
MTFDLMWFSQLLYHPAVQSGVLPLALALTVTAIPAGNIAVRAAFAVLFAFLLSAALTLGGGLLPLTSTSKLILGAAAAFVVFTQPALSKRRQGMFLGLFAIALPLWMLWPVIQRQGVEGAIQYGWMPFYSLYLAYSLGPMQALPRGRLASLLALSIGTGHCALIGASIVYAQLALGLGAGLAALALWYLVQARAGLTQRLAAPAAITLGTLGGGATVFANLPITALMILALVPQMVRLPVPKQWSERAAFVTVSLYCLVPVVGALTVVWRTAGNVGY